MMRFSLFLPVLILTIETIFAAPSVQLPYAKLVGIDGGFNTHRFLGVPYAQRGSGLRFTEGIPINETSFKKGTTIQATKDGKICPQPVLFRKMGEDCLNLDVTKPSNADSNSKLPVMVWIYGGGFIGGDVGNYKPMFAMKYANSLGVPFVHVAMNYRLNAFGFLCSKEMAQSGVCNLGLRDQRLALKWVKKYISYFGGDPDKVTIYGESAGGISVALHLTAFGATKETNLFRAGIAESGSSTSLVIPDYTFFQKVYDSVVEKAGCKSTTDTLACLRKVSYQKLSNIVNHYPMFGIVRAPWSPTVDGDFIPDSPFRLLQQGKVIKVPLIIGDNLDEGTGFVNHLVWNSTQFLKDKVKGTWSNLTSSSMDKLLSFYPDDPAAGSPYNTGGKTWWGPQGKRAASIYGDLGFVAPRRFLSEQLASRGVPVWAYRWDYNYKLNDTNSKKYLGVAHGYEVLGVYYVQPNVAANAIAAYWPAFAANLNPNSGLNGKFVSWTNWDKDSLNQIRFEQKGVVMKKDDYRKGSSDFVNSIAEEIYGYPTPPPRH
eukprot:TRINITY_DN4637_c0_g1_i1.p1 TRINITY_DN4637_c0_g1~~TRINITY_DN4637_c0_g1_i1.p1  ORF type:complete len:543 (-),score=161.91 TRINITY_DN4637_c0_g1_i1:33-1661(-)